MFVRVCFANVYETKMTLRAFEAFLVHVCKACHLRIEENKISPPASLVGRSALRAEAVRFGMEAPLEEGAASRPAHLSSANDACLSTTGKEALA